MQERLDKGKGDVLGWVELLWTMLDEDLGNSRGGRSRLPSDFDHRKAELLLHLPGKFIYFTCDHNMI
jgi:hypothetical protein